jgi:flavodoxin
MARVLDAEIRKPQQLDPQDLDGYDLIGFGSGIDSDKHYKPLLNFADKLPSVTRRQAFIFSTCGVPAFGFSDEYARGNHAALREKLQARGYTVVDEFSCVGWNSNSFLRTFGGINRGRPNAQDLQDAAAFAQRLEQTCRARE